jgi:peroxiredoxin
MWPVLKSLLGGTRMQALNAGTQAPQFELPAMDGSKFSLQNALTRGPALAVFFKISCPTCQYALPYFERFYKTYGEEKLSIVGISQNDKKDTADFMRKYEVTFPVLLDDTKTFPASNAYGLTNVPTAFWISADGEIEISSIGWARKDFEEIARKAASITVQAPKPLFQPGEQIADFRAG